MEYTNKIRYTFKKPSRSYGERLTVENQAMPVAEILKRVLEGRSVPSIQAQGLNLKSDAVFEDIVTENPDPLTAMDEVQGELAELGAKAKKKDEEKKAAEEKKRIESEAKKIADERKAAEEE